MVTPALLDFPAAPKSAIGAVAPRRRHLGILAIVISSLLVAITVGQFETVERGSFRYLLLIGVAALLPLFDLPEILKTLWSHAKLLFLFFVLAATWSLLAGDVRAAFQLGLFVLVLAWISTDRACLDVRDLALVYLGIVTVGIAISLTTDLNGYHLVPGRGAPPAQSDVAGGRVSFTPNIAYSGFLSLALLMVLTRNGETLRRFWFVAVVASYFLVFSFVRAAYLALALYAALYWWFLRYRSPRPMHLFWTALLVAAGFNLAILLAADILYAAQSVPLVSDLFLRGETGVSRERIAFLLYRPWLWVTQLKIFASSAWWMGWGSIDFYELAMPYSPPMITTGSESLPLRLLVVFGLPALLFVGYLISRLLSLAYLDDRWACACFPAIFTLMMNWGSTFHPADAMFVLFMMMIVRGCKGYRSFKTRLS